MSDTKPVEQMSSDELFELARKKRVIEEEVAQAELELNIRELQEERMEMVKTFKSALKSIDDELAKMGKPARRTSDSNKGPSNRKRGELSDTLIMVISTHQPVRTDLLKSELEKRGLPTKYLAQTLAYLKKKGRIVAPSRGCYRIA